MDAFGDDHIAHLLRLKRYEQPPPGYFENFLHEFHRRQRERDELFHQPLWRVCLERAEGFALRLNVRSLAFAGIAVLVLSTAMFSIRLYQQSATTPLAVQRSPIPSTETNTETELDSASVSNPTFDMQATLLPTSGDMLTVDSDEFVPLYLEWESLDDQSLTTGPP